MEYKIFGPARWPPPDFKEDLAAFFRLDDGQRDAIAEWFLSTRSFELYEPELPSVIIASALLPEQFRQAAGVIRLLLNNWQCYGLELPDLERDVLLLGCEPEQAKSLSTFLARLSSIRERVWVDGLEGDQQVLGLPTIDDVNIAWDARPIFGGSTYYYFADNSDDVSYKKFFGLTYLAILELISSDNYGQRQRAAIQMTEDTFKRLLISMKRAGEQLDTLKEHTKAIGPDVKGLRRG